MGYRSPLAVNPGLRGKAMSGCTAGDIVRVPDSEAR
jgi:hypothetical protein